MKTELKNVVNLIWGCDWIVTADTIYYDVYPDSMGHSLQSKGDKIQINIVSAGFLFRYGAYGRSWVDYLLERAKPVLRPLSDLTKEEFIEMCKLSGYSVGKKLNLHSLKNGIFHTNSLDRDGGNITWNDDCLVFNNGTDYDGGWEGSIMGFEHTVYLLKQGFDIFGLIKSKQAINKLKVKK